MENYRVSFVSARDKPEWRALFEGYADFYASGADRLAPRPRPLPSWS